MIEYKLFSIALKQRPKFINHPYNKPMQQRISAQSIQTYARAIRAFFGFLYREGFIDHNPTEKVRMPKVPTKVVPTFTEIETMRLLSQANKHTDVGFRDYALLLTFVDTGARLIELAELNYDDVDLENGYLRVMGKGNRERYIPFGQKVAKALLKYKLKHRPETVATDRFWLTADGRPKSALPAEEIEQLGKRSLGAKAIAGQLKAEGYSVSFRTVHRILTGERQ